MAEVYSSSKRFFFKLCLHLSGQSYSVVLQYIFRFYSFEETWSTKVMVVMTVTVRICRPSPTNIRYNVPMFPNKHSYFGFKIYK